MAHIRHVVMMAFKAGSGPDAIEALIRDYRALPDAIPTMKSFEWGPEAGVSTNTEGFTHCFVSTFEKIDHVRDYGPDPAHQAFVASIEPHLEKILVFDFEVR